MYRYSRGRNFKKIYYLQGGGLCFTERLSESLSVCLLATSHRNYRTDLHENFIKDVSLDKENNINFGNHPHLDHKNPKNEKKNFNSRTGKVNVDLYSALRKHISKRSGMVRVLKRFHSFTCTPRVHPLTE